MFSHKELGDITIMVKIIAITC